VPTNFIITYFKLWSYTLYRRAVWDVDNKTSKDLLSSSSGLQKGLSHIGELWEMWRMRYMKECGGERTSMGRVQSQELVFPAKINRKTVAAFVYSREQLWSCQ